MEVKAEMESMQTVKMETVCAELANIHSMLRAISVKEDDVERMAAAKMRLLNASALCTAAGKELAQLRAAHTEQSAPKGGGEE